MTARQPVGHAAYTSSTELRAPNQEHRVKSRRWPDTVEPDLVSELATTTPMYDGALLTWWGAKWSAAHLLSGGPAPGWRWADRWG